MPSWRQPPPGNCSDPGSPPAHGLGHLEGLVALHLNQPQTARWLPKLKQNNAASFPQQPSLPCFYSHSTGIFSLQAMFAMFCFAGNVTQSPVLLPRGYMAKKFICASVHLIYLMNLHDLSLSLKESRAQVAACTFQNTPGYHYPIIHRSARRSTRLSTENI